MKITKVQAENIYKKTIASKKYDDTKAFVFYSKEILDNRLNLLKHNFPQKTLHAIAIKACSQIDVLKHIVNSGFGLEAASIEEVYLAREAGIQNDKIVFDSPVKTRQEIHICHQHFPGIRVNANCLEELERYPTNFNGQLGLRINPLVSNDAPSIFNVSMPTSKFGVAISRKDEIIDNCIQHPQISCLHIHIGSNIKDFSNNIRAIKILLELANEINALRQTKGIITKIDTLDIGGGIDFDMEEDGQTVEKFTSQLKKIKGLFEHYELITEYGKFVHRTSSFAISDIEYVVSNNVEHSTISTAYIHLGADLFTRKVYSNLPIHYPISVLSDTEENKLEKYNIVGPLCFAGDVMFTNVELPKLSDKDKLIIYDIGANTYSMWSNHCSRKRPPFIFV